MAHTQEQIQPPSDHRASEDIQACLAYAGEVVRSATNVLDQELNRRMRVLASDNVPGPVVAALVTLDK